MIHQIYIALGSNLPASGYSTPADTVMAAIDLFAAEGLPVVRRSGIWLTEPIPVSDQPWYANAVIESSTDTDPKQLLTLLHRLESDFERVRTVQNAARTLDLDLIDYAGKISASDQDWPLLPHPRLQERGFVLFPLEEIAPDWQHPRTGKSIQDMISELDPAQKAARI